MRRAAPEPRSADGRRPAAALGRGGDSPPIRELLVLFLACAPRAVGLPGAAAGFTAAVSHELRTPLARLLVLLESATLPGADVDELWSRRGRRSQQTRELIDDVLFLGELETGREVVSLGRTRANARVEEVVAPFAERADHAEVALAGLGRDRRVELPLRPRMLRVVVENLLANAIRYAGPGSTCTIELTNRGRRAGAHRLRQRRGRRRGRPAAPLRALLPRRPGPHERAAQGSGSRS